MAVAQRRKFDYKRLKMVEARLKDIRHNHGQEAFNKGEFLPLVSPDLVKESEWLCAELRKLVKNDEDEANADETVDEVA